MKRNTLLIAIAAIAVVGIVGGLFLAGQNGQLAGTLGPRPTTLTLTYTVGMEDGSGGYELFLTGRLADSTGAPVANRAVNVRFTVPGETVINDAGTATTGPDGSYSLRIQQYYWYYGKHPVYTARFAGDSAYLASQSPGVAGP